MQKKIDRALASAALAATLPAHTCVDRPHLPCDACEPTYKVNADECVRLCEAMAAFWGDGVCEAPIYPGAYLTEQDVPIKDLIRAAVGWRKP
jgi:hypothetical protein